MDRHPEAIGEIATELIEGRFFDTTLAARVNAVQNRWLARAQRVIESRTPCGRPVRLPSRLEQIEADVTAEVEELIASVAPTDIDPESLPSVPDPPEPEVDEDDQPQPLCDSRWTFAEQTMALIESKRYLR